MTQLNYILCLATLTLAVSAQDIHWSQPSGPLLYYNPAFTGTTGKFSAAASYRDQWNALTSTYKTAFVAGDYRFSSDKQPMAFNAGLLFYNDVSGAGNLRTNCFGASVSSLLKSGEKTFLGAGLSYQSVNQTFFMDRYTWGAQYTGQGFDPSLPAMENTRTELGRYSDLHAGLAFLYEEGGAPVDYTANRRVLIGYSLHHLTRPQSGITGSGERKPMMHCFFAHAFLPGDALHALKPMLVTQIQGPELDLTGGVLYRTALGQISRITGIKKGAGISFGVMYRFRDAIIPVMEYEKENVTIGISYDLNVSKLTPASRLRGGAEITLRIRPNAAALRPVQPATPSTREFWDSKK